jgi:F420-non-reducing hydrogenase iron-sulfur subunit
MSWEPKIVVIACNWCTYAAADLAGSLRYKYPPTAYVVRVPCSGRVEPEFIVEALVRGADAVLVGG